MIKNSIATRFCPLCLRDLELNEFDKEWVSDLYLPGIGWHRTGDCNVCRVIRPWRRKALGYRFAEDELRPLCGRDLHDEWTRLGGRCAYCDILLIPMNFHIDHVHPKSKSGTNHRDNLVFTCPRCNLSKGKKLLGDWKPTPTLITDAEVVENFSKREAECIEAMPVIHESQRIEQRHRHLSFIELVMDAKLRAGLL